VDERGLEILDMCPLTLLETHLSVPASSHRTFIKPHGKDTHLIIALDYPLDYAVLASLELESN
jgi:hypothetical protein